MLTLSVAAHAASRASSHFSRPNSFGGECRRMRDVAILRDDARLFGRKSITSRSANLEGSSQSSIQTGRTSLLRESAKAISCATHWEFIDADVTTTKKTSHSRIPASIAGQNV